MYERHCNAFARAESAAPILVEELLAGLRPDDSRGPRLRRWMDDEAKLI